MKVTREQVAKNRKRILDRASKLFREKGFDGVGVADIMKSAGLTHGAFYGYFDSKDELMAQACAHALSMGQKSWSVRADKHPHNPLAAIVKSYLTASHRDDQSNGCPVAALGSDTARQHNSVRRAYTDGLRANVALLTRVAPGPSPAARRENAVAAMAGLVGALILARAVDDRALSDEILHAAAARLSPKAARVNKSSHATTRSGN